MVSEKRLLTELLVLYKHYPCLWDNRQIVYSNKEAKDQAYEVLLEKYREIHDEANMMDLKRKIEHMRASFRREHKKVLLSRLKGDGNDYTPHLWYYDLLIFLSDVSDFSRLESTSKEPDEDTQIDTDEPKPKKRASKRKLSPRSTVYLPEHDNQSSEDHMDNVDLTQTKLKEENDRDSLATISVNSILEHESFGNTVGLQLKDLEPMQRVIAEKLISDIIFEGRLNRLTVNSSVTHR